mmetsp:Transcript_29630/g.74647  ORF Transcript_29630/g.74647 Transcript_29630/m.74647 type:complete len:235 (+) Transcript_29630:986-1690(+)
MRTLRFFSDLAQSRVLLPPLSRSGAAAPPAAAAAGAGAPVPTLPMIASGAYFGMTSGGWIMLNSSDASFPANVMIASSPPGCSERKFVTSSTSPLTTTQQSLLVVCLATSSKVKPPPPPAAAAPGAAAAAAPALFMESSYDPPENLELCTAPVRPPPESSASEVSFTSLPSMYWAQALPATRPKTTQSNREFPPSRLLPCTPPATSPAAYKPGMAFPLLPTTAESTSISNPPMQ